MLKMRLMLATMALNEEEWLERLYRQHIEWEGVTELKWVFVESADRVYAETNPQLVTKTGLSVDRTSEILSDLHAHDWRVEYIQHGLCKHKDKAQGKCEARNRYLEYADEWQPDYLIVLDADEFWCKNHQANVLDWMRLDKHKTAFTVRHREIWHPPTLIHEPLFAKEVTGGFWDILYCRMWKWFPGIRYINNHNTPVMPNGFPLDKSLKNHVAYERYAGSNVMVPQYVHMGFAGNLEKRAAKNRYYEERGEKVDPKRSWYTESRKCFETWKPGDSLPRGARVVDYDGAIPEVFKEINDGN
jgi:hypothetical protein